MTQPTNTEIRRRSDGSIDMSHYVSIGRAEHAKAIQSSCGQLLQLADLDRLLSRMARSIITGRLSPNRR
jgi:hypothetical protein